MLELLETSRATLSIACAVATASGVAWLFSRAPYIHTIGGRKSPPGPKRQILIGNAKNFPRDNLHDRYAELQQQYGEFLFCRFANIAFPIV